LFRVSSKWLVFARPSVAGFARPLTEHIFAAIWAVPSV
jgi:hypothetical protein